MNQEPIKDYSLMTADEQLSYYQQLTQFKEEKLPEIETAKGNWTPEHIENIKNGFRLIRAYRAARNFAEKSLKYGDYATCIGRMTFYVNLIIKEIADASPEIVDVKPPARRGRPASPATIAKREAEAKQPKLFEGEEVRKSAGENPLSPSHPLTLSPYHPLTPSPSTDRLHLDQLKWLMSPGLAEDVDKIRGLRTQAAAAAERAKTMSDLKASPAKIAPVAKEAAEATEAYQAIYARVDSELATVHYRLKNDGEYLKKFRERFKKDDVSDVVKLLNPYWQKMQDDAEFLVSVKQLIERESPEFVAQQKADAEKKKEVQDIIRYLKRKDKQQKPETAREKFKRLEALLGKKAAADYKPLLNKIIEDRKSGLGSAAFTKAQPTKRKSVGDNGKKK